MRKSIFLSEQEKEILRELINTGTAKELFTADIILLSDQGRAPPLCDKGVARLIHTSAEVVRSIRCRYYNIRLAIFDI